METAWSWWRSRKYDCIHMAYCYCRKYAKKQFVKLYFYELFVFLLHLDRISVPLILGILLFPAYL